MIMSETQVKKRLLIIASLTQMKKVSDKFDDLDNKLDDLESKRGQLRQVFPSPCHRPLSLAFTST